MITTFAASGLHRVGDDFPLLTLLIAIPVIGALLTAVLPERNDKLVRTVGIGASIITGLLSVFLLLAFSRGNGNFQFVAQHPWIKDFGISWKLGVDGISLFLVVLSGLMFPIALLFQQPKENRKAYYAWMLLLEAGCIGSFLALDLFLFFVFFEAVLVPMYFLIAGWGYARRGYAALKFFLYTLAGSAFLFVGMLALVLISAHNNHGNVTFDIVALQQHPGISATEARWLFFAFALAFAVKIPIFPVHTWLPDTYEQSPIAGVVISAAVMVKLGTYGLVRFGLFLFPKAAHDMAPLLLTLALIGMIYGAVIAAVNKDLKRLLAYSSLSHLGFIVLGTFAFSSEGLSGAVLQMINHGLSTGALFLIVGMIYARRGTSEISQLRGLQKAAPVMAAVMTVAVMSSIGVPGLNGFVGEFLVLLGTFVTHRWWAVVGTSAVVLAAVYLLWAYQQVFHGEPDGENAKINDLTHRERWLIAPLIVLIVFLGVFPKPVLQRIEPSVDRILQTTPGYAQHKAHDGVTQPVYTAFGGQAVTVAPSDQSTTTTQAPEVSK
jgi:NADH-quinone oxidoreductase subunit M